MKPLPPNPPASESPAAADPPCASSRRNFLSGGVVLAGAAIAGTNLRVARGAHAFGSDTIKVGLIGCGARGTEAAIHALNTSQSPRSDVKLVALADLFPNRLQTAYRTIKGKHATKVDLAGRRFVGFDGFERLLETDIDVVILATPPGFRPLHFEAAVHAGKHVFMETPLATDAPGVRRILAANTLAKQNGLVVHVGLQRRHEPRYRECMERLHEGAIGELLFARAYWNSGGIKMRPRTAHESELEFQIRNWGAFTWLGGDPICEHHIHNLDIINWLVQSHPIEAHGMGGREPGAERTPGQGFDHHVVEFTYPGGLKLFSQCRRMPACWNRIGEYVHGSDGTADISNALIRCADGKKRWHSNAKAGKGPGRQQEFRAMFASLRSGQLTNEVEHGAASTMTAIMGRMATYSGKVVTWDHAIHDGVQLACVDSIRSLDGAAPVQPGPNGQSPVPIPGDQGMPT